jgi:hypothetical protein
VNYDLFRIAQQEALRGAGLQMWSFADETILLQNMARGYRAYVSLGGLPSAGSFSVTAELSWKWDALLSARSETVEEDMLMQVLGDDRRDVPTEPPWLRVDVVLHATRPWGKPLPMPARAAWKRWVAKVESRLEPLLSRGVEDHDGMLAVLAWRGEPEAEFICRDDGQLALTAVQVSAWEGVTLPRQWDDPDRGYDEEPDEQLADLFRRIARALQVWEAGLDDLQGQN